MTLFLFAASWQAARFSFLSHLQLGCGTTPDAPIDRCPNWILMDYASGKVLSEGNADEKLDPASLTKIGTSYVVGQALKAGKD